MVKLNTTVYCLIATLAIPGLAATVSDLSSAISDVVTKVKAENALLNTIPAGSTASLGTGYTLILDAQDVTTSIDKVTSTVKSLSAADIAPAATTLLAQFQGIEPVATSTLNSLVAKKPALVNLPGSATLILTSLNSLDKSIINMENAFLDRTPANLASQVQSLRTNLNTAYTNALQAFSD